METEYAASTDLASARPAVAPGMIEGAMIIVHVHAHVKSESVEAFRKATVANARQSVLEPGIARFDVLQRLDDRTRLLRRRGIVQVD